MLDPVASSMVSNPAVVYEAWESSDGAVVFTRASGVSEHQAMGLVTEDAKLLHRIVAEDWQEALTEHCLVMGWEPRIHSITDRVAANAPGVGFNDPGGD